jgi:hypothetical protein
MYVILATQETEIRRSMVQSQPGQIVHKTLSQKHPTHKRADRVAQAVVHLLSNGKALNSSPVLAQKKL